VTGTVRAFVAVIVPGAPPSEGVPRYAAADHLTLQFLGEVDDVRVDALARALGPALARAPPFDFALEGLGAFPTAGRPRVVWRGVSRGASELDALARTVRDTVESVGIAPDRSPFVPHVTLFRVRTPRDRERADRLLRSGDGVPPPQVVAVTAVELVESRLEPAGAVHRTFARFPLGGTGP
jgi:RNA 2',3'-cyclic 3'-phosphodiesterase